MDIAQDAMVYVAIKRKKSLFNLGVECRIAHLKAMP
jgi:hypothetical protein